MSAPGSPSTTPLLIAFVLIVAGTCTFYYWRYSSCVHRTCTTPRTRPMYSMYVGCICAEEPQ